MKISDQSMSTGVLRQNILEKANEAFSENKKPEEFSKKINDAINSVAESQNKAAQITKSYYATTNFKYCISNDTKCEKQSFEFI